MADDWDARERSLRLRLAGGLLTWLTSILLCFFVNDQFVWLLMAALLYLLFLDLRFMREECYILAPAGEARAAEFGYKHCGGLSFGFLVSFVMIYFANTNRYSVELQQEFFFCFCIIYAELALLCYARCRFLIRNEPELEWHKVKAALMMGHFLVLTPGLACLIFFGANYPSFSVYLMVSLFLNWPFLCFAIQWRYVTYPYDCAYGSRPAPHLPYICGSCVNPEARARELLTSLPPAPYSAGQEYFFQGKLCALWCGVHGVILVVASIGYMVNQESIYLFSVVTCLIIIITIGGVSACRMSVLRHIITLQQTPVPPLIGRSGNV